MERYDIESDRWSAVAPMNTPRGGVGSVALMVSLFPCRSGPGSRPAFQISSKSSKQSFPVQLFQNHVYAVGGNDGIASLSSVEKYDPHLDKWMEVKEMGQRRAGNGVSELHGCLYVVGK